MATPAPTTDAPTLPAVQDFMKVALGDDPTPVAQRLANDIRARGFINRFPQKDKKGNQLPDREVPSYLGWKYACTRLGLGICNRWVKNVPTHNGQGRQFVAYAELVHLATGTVVASGNGTCRDSENGKQYKSDDDLASMAQTRAGRKACNNALEWIMQIGGLGTEEPEVEQQEPPTAATGPKPGSPHFNPQNARRTSNNDLPKGEQLQEELPALPVDHSLPAVKWQRDELQRLSEKPHCPLSVRQGIEQMLAKGDALTIDQALRLRTRTYQELESVGIGA